jgi:hypothetical protein
MCVCVNRIQPLKMLTSQFIAHTHSPYSCATLQHIAKHNSPFIAHTHSPYSCVTLQHIAKHNRPAVLPRSCTQQGLDYSSHLEGFHLIHSLVYAVLGLTLHNMYPFTQHVIREFSVIHFYNVFVFTF